MLSQHLTADFRLLRLSTPQEDADEDAGKKTSRDRPTDRQTETRERRCRLAEMRLSAPSRFTTSVRPRSTQSESKAASTATTTITASATPTLTPTPTSRRPQPQPRPQEQLSHYRLLFNNVRPQLTDDQFAKMRQQEPVQLPFDSAGNVPVGIPDGPPGAGEGSDGIGRGIVIGLLSAFGSAGVALLVLALFFFLRYTQRGRILLDRLGRPGEYDDEQEFAREEAEALEAMDELQAAEYFRAKGWSTLFLLLGIRVSLILTTGSLRPGKPPRDDADGYIALPVPCDPGKRRFRMGV